MPQTTSPTISTSIPTTLEILTNVNSVSPDSLCYWNIRVPDKKIVNVTIDQLVMEEMNAMEPKPWTSAWKIMSTSNESSMYQC